MHRKLQIFVSSTFTDLRSERQAAVEAILDAGHIPAGMELFASNDKEQMEVIREWIRNSDAQLLLLAGRYGSVEPVSGKSYTHLEYDFGRSIKKPLMAIVMNDSAIEERGRTDLALIERDHGAKLRDFRREVMTGRIVTFFGTTDGLKHEIGRALRNVVRTYPDLVGWVPGNHSGSVEEATKRIAALELEKEALKRDVSRRDLLVLNAGAVQEQNTELAGQITALQAECETLRKRIVVAELERESFRERSVVAELELTSHREQIEELEARVIAATIPPIPAEAKKTLSISAVTASGNSATLRTTYLDWFYAVASEMSSSISGSDFKELTDAFFLRLGERSNPTCNVLIDVSHNGRNRFSAFGWIYESVSQYEHSEIPRARDSSVPVRIALTELGNRILLGAPSESAPSAPPDQKNDEKES